MLTVISGGKTYTAAASTRRESKSVQCQTLLTWVFSECPLRTTESNVCSTGGPGSVSTGIQASSGKSRTVLANTRVPCGPAKCSSEMDRGSADPPKWPLGVPPIPTKWHLRVLQLPPKVASKDDSSLRCSPTKVRVDGVLVDVKFFLHPRRSATSSRPQVPPKPVA